MLRVVNVAFSNLAKSAAVRDGSYVTRYVQFRTITSKKYFRPNPHKPPPYPYKNRLFTYNDRFIDNMYQRFDENTKLIVVDGQVAVGKHEIAKEIAEELGFEFFPDVTMDRMYINEYGFDFRQMDYKLPEGVQSFDEKKFLLNPTHFNVAAFQANKYRLRFAHYIDCLAHLMNTGQGVVVVRSPYSDCIFANAMADAGYINEPALYTYNEIVRHSILFLMRPHLYIYIGASTEATMKNIKNKKIPHLSNSKALTTDYVDSISRYAANYILGASINSHVLQYDWSDGGEVEIIVEDIERLDFDAKRHWTDPKFNDWNMEEEEAEDYRYRYTRDKVDTIMYVGTPCVYEAPEMFATGAEMEVFMQVYQSSPGMEYDPGWNPGRGDKTLTKVQDRGQTWCPMGC